MRKKLDIFIAGRYLRSRKSHSVVNLIAWVSSAAVAVPVAAMVILMSVFNGFEGMIKAMFTHFDPDIMVEAAAGKTFASEGIVQLIAAVDGVAAVSPILDENALLVYGNRQYIAKVRGVDDNFGEVIPIDAAVDEGEFSLYFGDRPQALVGRGVAYNLGVNYSILQSIKIFVPRRGAAFSSLLPMNAFRSGYVLPSGIFTLDAQTDGEYMLIPLDYAQNIFGYDGRVSGIMVRTDNPASVKAELGKMLGDEYSVKDRYQQKASLYRVMTAEKWGIFFIVLLVLLISSCATVGSAAMLIIDKRDDIFTMSVMGADRKLTRRIFVNHGMMVSMIGAAAGLVLGLGFCFAQQYLGLIPMPAQSFLMDSYPVAVQWGDIALVAAVVTAINYIIIKFTVSIMISSKNDA